jgi:hypothetical protein
MPHNTGLEEIIFFDKGKESTLMSNPTLIYSVAIVFPLAKQIEICETV